MSQSLQISGLTKTFADITAVADLSLSAEPGSVVALLGPNGAGKSTLMDMIAGYLSPDAGQIKILGRDIAEAPLAGKDAVGFLPEGAPLYPDMSVRDFLNYIGALKGASPARIQEAAELAQIMPVWLQKNETLSKGYQRRVGFAAAILSDPPLLLLDEPTDGLDPNQKEHIQKLIRQMGKDKTILISTHLLDEAEAIADRIIIMSGGRIKADGTLSGILRQARSANLADAFKKLTR